MNSRKYGTTLYVASVPGRIIPSRAEVRKSLWEYFLEFAKDREFPVIEEKQQISYNNNLISFRVSDVPLGKLYLLSFQPTGEDRNRWRKERSIEASLGVLGFCGLLGSEITIPLSDLVFKRVGLSDQDSINISNWEVTYPFSRPATKSSLGDFLRKTSQTRYENVFLSIPKNNEFHIFTETFFKGIEPFPQLRNILSNFGLVKGPRSMMISKEFGETLATRIKKKSIFVFLEKERLLETWYENLKIFFDSSHIPTQYITEGTAKNKLPRFPGVRANLLLEMLTKMGKPPIILQAPEEIFINDGFLCLSDVVSTHQRLFGALFTYSKYGLSPEEEVQIYDDIEFETPTTY